MDEEKRTPEELQQELLSKLVTYEPRTIQTVVAADLNAESKDLLKKIIAETDLDKSKDLTQLFNINQNKKTLVRVDKLSELMDAITDQALTRFTQRPDEISNQELLQSMKTVADLIDKGQTKVSEPEPQPLIQINQQNNEVNVDGGKSGLNRESREKVKNAVLALLGQIQNQPQPTTPPIVELEEPDEDTQDDQ